MQVAYTSAMGSQSRPDRRCTARARYIHLGWGRSSPNVGDFGLHPSDSIRRIPPSGSRRRAPTMGTFAGQKATLGPRGYLVESSTAVMASINAGS
jgi:hypothetical protein